MTKIAYLVDFYVPIPVRLIYYHPEGKTFDDNYWDIINKAGDEFISILKDYDFGKIQDFVANAEEDTEDPYGSRKSDFETTKRIWKQWCCKTLDEEEIKLVTDTMPNYNFESFAEDQIERIAKRFRKLVSDRLDDWVYMIKEAIESEVEFNERDFVFSP